LLANARDFAKNDGLADREWSVTTGDACQDDLQLPDVPISLVRQPPVPANVRPPDNVTADWCQNLVFKPTGEITSFIVYGPPLPLLVGQLTVSEDFDHSHERGTYTMQTTIRQERTLYLSETCLTSQGIRLTCPQVGRRLGEYLATEANIYNMRCEDPPSGQGGCDCFFQLSFIGGPNGRWSAPNGSTQITFFDELYAPPAVADYCYHPDSADLELTGSNVTWLFNQKSLRTLYMTAPSCHDGVQNPSNNETGVDCGPGCPMNPPCGTCMDGVANGDEEGIDCGGACLGVMCDPDTSIPRDQRHASCADGKQEPWEEGLDCGGPCTKECP
jgi:hypothetical protein